MKIQCNVCEVVEANVLCCADEAALCWACDEKVHAANKLASKHQRLPFATSSSPMPKCDICQEAVGYFFCLEDRALLCRKCDVVVHTANAYVSSHQRFLLTGAKVGLEPTEPGASLSTVKSYTAEKISERESHAVSRNGNSFFLAGQPNKVSPVHFDGVGDFPPTKLPMSGGSAAVSIPEWQLDEYLGLPEFSQTFGCTDNLSSKVNSRGNCTP